MTGESVEQAALRRAEIAELPAPWPEVLDSLQSIAGVNESLFALIDLIRDNHASEIESLHAENAELRDGLLALSNRIESVTQLAIRTRERVDARMTPLWICLCGARNRLRDLTCQSCGGPKP